MKKRIIQAGYIGALLLFGGYAQAQVKVGDNPTTINANSALEVESTNKGLLVPRIALTGTTAASPMSAHVAGMTVYNTATAGTAPNNVTPGFYYNDGTRWVAVIGNEVTNATTNMGLVRTGTGTTADPYTLGLTAGTATGDIMKWNNSTSTWAPSAPSASGWMLTGNAGTTAGTNYIGTTDAVDFVTKTSGTERIRVTATGNIGIGTVAAPTAKLVVNGAATNESAHNAGATTTIDFSLSNLAYTSTNAGAFTLNNLKNGGTYTLAVQGTTSGTATFTAAGFTFKSTNNGATEAGKQTVYTFLVMGTTVYFFMNSGF